MAEYDTLLPEVLPEVPGCTDPLAVREIRTATIELCSTAKIVKQRLSGQSVVADDAYVTVQIPNGSNLIHLTEVTLDGYDVHHYSEDELDLHWRDEQQRLVVFKDYHYRGFNPDPDGWRVIESDRPCAYHLEVSDVGTRIRLVGIPRLAYSTLAYRMVLKPNRVSTGYADWVLDDYFETIAAGAIARLLAMPKKAWTDMATAAVYRQRFIDGVAEAYGEGMRDFTRDDEPTGRTTPCV